MKLNIFIVDWWIGFFCLFGFFSFSLIIRCLYCWWKAANFMAIEQWWFLINGHTMGGHVIITPVTSIVELSLPIFTCIAEGESRCRSAVTPSVRPSVCLSVCPKILSLQLLCNYWSNYHETWYVDRKSYVVMHISRKFWSPLFCGSYAPWNLENIRKSTNNVSFLCQFFINEIIASDAGPDIIRSHLFFFAEKIQIYTE